GRSAGAASGRARAGPVHPAQGDPHLRGARAAGHEGPLPHLRGDPVPAGHHHHRAGRAGRGPGGHRAGTVQVLRVDGAKVVPLASLQQGQYVGELSLVDEAPTSARVVAQSGVRGMFISRLRFQQYLYTHEAAALRIYTLFTKTLAERLRQANKRN
ncbi:MAG: cyclic nucleotide-binding domain-containing protein, partial [Deltaproteobacteria bacterium]|nr:cyclic nucleotide-binding domain-containing protein [Deltaproteobacteria bacterium]